MYTVLVRTLNNRWLLLALMFTTVSLGVFLGWLYSKPGATLGWTTSQFFFSYQDLGFVSRGLVATVLHPFPVLLSTQGLLLVTAAILIAFVVTWWDLFERCTQHLDITGRATLALVFLLAPSTLLHLGLDYGRFDPLNLALVIVAARCLQRSRDLLAALLVSIAVLVHEGFLILEFPLLCAYVLSLKRTSYSQQLGRLVRFGLLPSAATIAILVWGKYEPGIDSLMARFEANALYHAAALNGAVDRDALLVIVRTLKDNLDFNVAFFLDHKPWLQLVFIGPWFCVVTLFYDRFFMRNRFHRDLLYYSAYSPLLMSIIACDYFRWVALTSINMFIVLLLKIESRGQSSEPIVVPWDSITKIFAASCLLGPISDGTSFPYFIHLLNKINLWLVL
jgi:hypothetical protein